MPPAHFWFAQTPQGKNLKLTTGTHFKRTAIEFAEPGLRKVTKHEAIAVFFPDLAPCTDSRAVAPEALPSHAYVVTAELISPEGSPEIFPICGTRSQSISYKLSELRKAVHSFLKEL